MFYPTLFVVLCLMWGVSDAAALAERQETGSEETDEDPWCEYPNSFLYSYASWTWYSSLEEAKAACLENSRCKGITQEPRNGGRYTLRKGPTLHEGKSPSGETSWVLCN